MNKNLFIFPILTLLVFASTPTHASVPNVSGTSLVQYVGTSTGSGKISNGHMTITMSVSQGDFLVVIVGINQALHPVTSVSDSSNNIYTNRIVAMNPGPDIDAWINIWTASARSGGSDSITVSTSSTRDNVLVMEYSGVTGVGNMATNGGKSTLASVSISLRSSASAVVGGSSSFTGTATDCGYASPYSGGSKEMCFGTTGSTNNVGTLAMSTVAVGSTHLTMSAAKPSIHAWAFAAIELLLS